MTHHLRPLNFALLGVLTLTAGAASSAEYTASAQVDVKHVDNVLRSANEVAQSDTLVAPSIDVSAVLPMGPHSWVSRLTLSTYRYSAVTEMNHSDYDLSSAWHWQSGNRLFGNMGVRSSQRHSDYLSDGLTTFSGLNLQKSQSLFFRAQYGRSNEWVAGLTGDWQWNKSGVVNVQDDLQQSAFGGFVTWSPTPRINGSVSCNVISSTRKGLSPVSGQYGRCEINSGISLLKAGTSQLDLKFGRTQLFSQIGSNGGWNGSIRGTWAPTGKVRVFAFLERTIGTTSQSEVVGVDAAGESVSLSNVGTTVDERVSLGAEWSTTAQWVNKLNVKTSRRTSENSLSVLDFSSTVVAEDRTRSVRLESIYSFTRQLSGTLSWTGEHRTPNETGLAPSFDVNTLAAQVKYQFR